MTPTEKDKELSEKLRVMIRGYLRNYTDIARDSSVYANEVLSLTTADRERVALEARIEGEKIGAFMAALSILSEMAPLMVHRLEQDFPSMTAEVIGTVYETVKKEMKPYQDSRKAQQEEV